LEKYDADGSGIKLGSVTMSSKGKIKKDYETPFGTVSVERYRLFSLSRNQFA
jgi:hypothetical protein